MCICIHILMFCAPAQETLSLSLSLSLSLFACMRTDFSALKHLIASLIHMAHVHDQQFEDAQQTAQHALASTPPVLTRRFLLRVAGIVEHSEEDFYSPSRCAIVCEMCPRTCARGRELHNHCWCVFHQTTDMVPVRASIASRRQHFEVQLRNRDYATDAGTAQDRRSSH